MRFLGLGETPEDIAAREAALARRAEMDREAERVRQAELLRQTQDMAALDRGGIPTTAMLRLKEIGASDADEILFTSDFSPEEAALLRREGYRVRGIVSGSAMYHVGQAYASAYNDCEVNVLSQAYDEACRLAVGRMSQELRQIGGHGAVGVRFSLVRHEWADKTIEVQVLGTAVEGPGLKPKDPWMCDLSGQEWWALRRAGYDPVALVWGHCTWFLLTTQQDEWLKQSWQNVELTHWSQGLSNARHIAMKHVLSQAKACNANGICGIDIERKVDEIHLTGAGENPVYEREHHNLVLSIVGTAIKVRSGSPTAVPATVTVLSLRDGRMTPVSLVTQDATIE